jgi:alkylated DNA repair protein (DNA oxidative demethylase)
MNDDLCDLPAGEPEWHEHIGPASVVMRGFALKDSDNVLRAIRQVAAQAPFRQMLTPGGYKMSVAITSCGARGWVTDRLGYRYSPHDPLSGIPWPPMPDGLADIAHCAALNAGFSAFHPDSCLINRYQTGAKMSLHQDKDEHDLTQPIVSVSLGTEAVFLFGGLARSDKTQRITLRHGDVVVWGGPDRLRFHGILPLKSAYHPDTGEYRYNLTFRHS